MTSVCEFELFLAPRDAHMKNKGVWMVNSDARKAVEVNIRKVTEADRAEFEASTRKELIRLCRVKPSKFVLPLVFHQKDF